METIKRYIDGFLLFYPHPSLPPRGKEPGGIKLFPFGGNGKGGKTLIKNEPQLYRYDCN